MKKKKVLAVILVAGMVLGCAGCGSKSGEETSKGKKEAAAVPEDIWEPYEEEVTIRTALPENVAIVWDEGDDYDDNQWYREYKERFNIKVTNDWVSNDYKTKLNLTIADRDLPDVFVVNAEQMQQLKAADQIWDLTEVFDTQASDILKGYMEKEKATYETGFIDGKLYGIPQLNQGMDWSAPLWVRRDWKEQAGIGEIKTMDDFAAMARKFQEQHGGYTITETDTLMSMNAMANGWGAYPGIWVEQEDGTIGYGSVQPEMKEVLTNYAQWYKEGLIDPEFTITDGDKMFQKILNGEAGISPFSTWFVWGVGPGSVSEMGVDSYFDAYPIPSATGEPAKAGVKFENYGYIVVSKQCQNPDAVVRLINFYVHMADDAKEEVPELSDKLFNLGTIPYALRVFNTDAEYNRYVKISEALATGEEVDTSTWGPDGMKYRNCLKVMKEQDPQGAGDYFVYGSPKCAYSVSKELADKDLLVRDKLWGMPTKTLGKTGSTLDDILVEGFTKIIVGEESVDYFDTLIANWSKAGGDQVTKEVNETYGK